MTKFIRHRIIGVILLCFVGFALIFFARPLSILTTCQRDKYARCDDFFEYYQPLTDGYHGDYSEFRDQGDLELGGLTFLLMTIPFLMLIGLDIDKNRFKSRLQTIKLNQSEIGKDERK